MRCSLRIKRSAAKALAALPKADRLRVVEAIDLLCDTPAAGSALKGEFEGLRRLRPFWSGVRKPRPLMLT
ncbi:hypothetical protein VB716_10540 [Synechococcus sp. CCY9201]|uniref:hypothetical protein n=1 Tax=Synechococcus sp. CCY9201 TaxID=174697 RepID=UPI002B1E990F|nr:hypothetical protein [Synechococcus sp. CCY9201]MEA5474657.1 hypothetical protein [Synechococcus sp. CCY9201]